jgi:hypothetical protein
MLSGAALAAALVVARARATIAMRCSGLQAPTCPHACKPHLVLRKAQVLDAWALGSKLFEEGQDTRAHANIAREARQAHVGVASKQLLEPFEAETAVADDATGCLAE